MGIKIVILVLIITIGILLYFLLSNLYELYLKKHPPKENPMEFFDSYERKYKDNNNDLLESPTLSNNSFPKCLSDLGFSTYPTEQELKTKYRELVKKYHPDKGGDAKDFEKVSKAYNEALKIIKLRKGEN